MWNRTTLKIVNQQPSLVRYYAKSLKKRMREKISVLKQDITKFPKYEFLRSKNSDRRVYVWGQATTGACGVNESMYDQKFAKTIRHPTRLSFAERFDVIDIAAGYGFTLFACKPTGDDITLFGTGLNTDSQLGYQKHGGDKNKPMELLFYPAPISLPKGHDDESLSIKKVAAGRAHAIALSESNVLFSLGNNSLGQCGRPIVDDELFQSSQFVHRIESKTIIGDNDKVKDIVCGLDHSLILTENGKVFSCGWGADGQTGLGHFNSIGEWTQVLGDIKAEKIVKIASKFDCVLALNGKQRSKFTLIFFPSKKRNGLCIDEKNEILFVFVDKNEVFGWGNSEYNQLDLHGGIQQTNTPIHLQNTKKCGKVIDIASGGSACMVLNGITHDFLKLIHKK